MINKNELYKIGQMVGLNKKEIDKVLKNITNRKEQPSFSVGSPCYHSTRYGTISINDF
jgi:hypothetical protein